MVYSFGHDTARHLRDISETNWAPGHEPVGSEILAFWLHRELLTGYEMRSNSGRIGLVVVCYCRAVCT
jgi:hypothetical protein